MKRALEMALFTHDCSPKLHLRIHRPQADSMLMSRHFPALAAMLLAASPVGAQQIPDAGRLLEQIKPAPNLPRHEAPRIEIEERPALEGSDGVRIRVAHLRISGATIFSEVELYALVADAEGKELTLGELRNLADRVTRHYREQGYLLARAYLPAQDVTNGAIDIAVIEGRLGKIEVNNTAAVGGAALAPLAQLRTGESTRQRTLERSLLLLSDLPGVEVKSTLKPGATVGATDLLVDVAPGRKLAGRVDFDSFGDRFSGQFRLGGSINLNNPLQIGDQASLRATVSDEGMNYVRGSYQLPITSYGTRVGIAASDMRYHLGKTFAPLNATGDARIGSLYLLHPVVRSRTVNLNAELQYDRKKLQDQVGATATETDKSLYNWTTGINGDFQDGLGEGGANSYSFAYTAGHLELDPVTHAIDASTARASGGFAKWNLSWLRLQRLNDAASLYFSGMGQAASKNLNSSEKLSLGGAYGVRAYPQGEAPGDNTALITLEVRYKLALALPGIWQLTAFVDSGKATVNKNPWTQANNKIMLSGAGVGVNIAQAAGWTMRGSLAWKLRAHLPSADVDRTPRTWFQATKDF